MNELSDATSTVLRPEGNLVIADYRDTLGEIENAMNSTSDAIIDLSGIDRIDSVAVAVLCAVLRKAQFNGHTVRFANIPEQLTGLINLYELNEFFKEAGP